MRPPTPEELLKWAEEDLKVADRRYKRIQAELDVAGQDWQDSYDDVQRLRKAVNHSGSEGVHRSRSSCASEGNGTGIPAGDAPDMAVGE